MKKTRFFIYGMFNPAVKGPVPKMVSGYFVYVDGVAIGLHRWDKNTEWIASELSTGIRIIAGDTREKAIEAARPYLPAVRDLLKKEKMIPVKQAIEAAYKAA